MAHYETLPYELTPQAARERGEESELLLVSLLESEHFPFVDHVVRMKKCHPNYDMRAKLIPSHPLRRVLGSDHFLVDAKSSLAGIHKYMDKRKDHYDSVSDWTRKNTFVLNAGPRSSVQKIQGEFVFQLLLMAGVWHDEEQWPTVLELLPPEMVAAFRHDLIEGLTDLVVPLFMWDSATVLEH